VASLGPIDVSAPRTACSGSVCEGCGRGGARLSCWSNRPRSTVGIGKDFGDGGGVTHGDSRDDHASTHNFEASSGVWRRRTVSGAPRGSMANCSSSASQSPNARCRGLPDRRTRPSQTWRTFLANHIGNLTFNSTVTSSFATSDEDVDASVLLCLLFRRRHAPGGSCLLSGWWSMGLLRSNRRCLAGKSRRITFAAAHPHGSDLARARRGRVPSNPLPALPSDSVIIGHFWRRRELAHETQNVREHSSDVVFGSDTF